MTSNIRHTAKVLLIELETLKGCQSVSPIQTLSLLEEVLKDAGHLAKQVSHNIPGSLEERNAAIRSNSARINAQWNEAAERAERALQRSRDILTRNGLN